MTTYLITRHPGALHWARQKKLHFDVHTEHLESFDGLGAGDVVIGTLPINMVYELNRRQIRYVHLSLQIPRELRGIELNADQLHQCNAELQEFRVERIASAVKSANDIP